MIRISDLKLPADADMEALKKKIIRELNLNKTGGKAFDPKIRILKRSLDARKKPEIYYVYSVAVTVDPALEKKILEKNRNKKITEYTEKPYTIPISASTENRDPGELKRPVIIGDGPCGLFCAYILTLAGLAPLVIERGSETVKRSETVEKFFKTGVLDPECNVQFGEGGAGAFSDGKLNTSVKDKNGRDRFVLDTFVKYGAKEETAYDAKPHLGTDVIAKVVRSMRLDMESMGCKFLFDTKVTGIGVKDGRITGVNVGDRFISADRVVLATGHSASDTFEMLIANNVNMKAKPFAVGLRLEHSQRMMDISQYGRERGSVLPASDYKVTNRTSKGRNVYSFCMCPGGYVIDSSSAEGELCINGMSYSGRDGDNCNAAIVAAVDERDYGTDSVLSGMRYIKKLERKAYSVAGGAVPYMSYGEFKTGHLRKDGEYGLTPCIKGRHERADITGILPDELNEAIIESIE
nr:FAD-dependent oxidoreductase [Lachnospiraceae bacterium]